MRRDRCLGCSVLALVGALLLAPLWLVCGLVMAWARLGDLMQQRRMRRRLRRAP